MASCLLSFIWFSCGTDSACLLESVASARGVAPESALYVHFDPEDPLDAECIWSLMTAGVRVYRSAASHGGDLNGAVHIAQQLLEMGKAAGSGIVVKIDSDTLLVSLDWLALPLKRGSPVKAVGFNAGHASPWAGSCYALRAGVPQILRDALGKLLRPGPGGSKEISSFLLECRKLPPSSA